MSEYHLQVSELSHSFGGQVLFEDVHFTMRSGDRIALAGSNGSGKSTFMKFLAGSMQPDTGVIVLSKHARIAYLPQEGVALHTHSVYSEAEQVYSHIVQLIERRQEIADFMAAGNHNESLLEEYGSLQEHIENSGYYSRESVIESTLTGLGFNREDLQRACSEFSGGWRMRIALAKLLIDRPDFILLDEPTNYLDIEARQWLENWMQRFEGGILLVAHDRYFLDTTMKQVVELFQGNLRRYPGSYSRYEQVRTEEIVQLTREYEKQKDEISRHEDFIRRFRYNARKAKQVQSRVKMLDKIDTIELPPHLKPIAIPMPTVPHSGKEALHLENLNKSYGQLRVLNNLDLHIQRGECIALTGRNGMGKSTLLRIIAGQDQKYDGQVILGSGVRTGFYAQESAYSLPPDLSILEYLEQSAPPDRIGSVRDLLGAFLFHGDSVEKPLKVLSGGERSRVALLNVLLQPVNFLLLDEPTNHLDIISQDVLADALQRYSGTVIVVSHDHDFLERVASRVFELGPGKHRNFPGDYAYYRHRLAAEAQDTSSGEETRPGSQVTEQSANEQGTTDYHEQKKRRSLQQKLEKEEARILKEIEVCENTISMLQEKLAKPEVYSDGEQARETQIKISDAQSQLEKLTEEWESTESELSALN
ncbi:ABC-F family ATP-binding cassette domain-containing protein [Spirochaeta dissipatitropha]